MQPNGRSFLVEVSLEIERPCAFELQDGDGNSIALSAGAPPGPAPLAVRRAFYNGVEPGTYTAILYTCDGNRYYATVTLAPGNIPELRFPG